MKPVKRDPGKLAGKTFDLLIIGGGITGAGSFRDAVLRGLSVALIDKGDFASGTSSASSKLVHGGLRYLEQYQFGVVREALRERHTLLRIAPHLVQPLRFLIPIYKGYGRSRIILRMGLMLYDFLSGRFKVGRPSMLSRQEIRELRPDLHGEGLAGAAVYYDAQMDDSRLCLLNMMDGWNRGGIACNYIAASNVSRREDLFHTTARDVRTGEQFEIRSRTILNATGPWSDGFLRESLGMSVQRLAPSKGTHLVFSGQSGRDAALLFAPDDRIFFSIPWYGATLVGTTDTAFVDSPDNANPTADDRNYLLDGISRYFGSRPDWESREVGAFSGIRPLIGASGKSTYQASREELLTEDLPGLWSMVGGKYTTYRAMAERAINAVCEHLRKGQSCETHRIVLPGGEIENYASWESETLRKLEKETPDREVLQYLMRAYGASVEEFLRIHGKDELQRVDPAVPIPIASLHHGREYEMAVTEEDCLRRRTPLALLSGLSVKEGFEV